MDFKKTLSDLTTRSMSRREFLASAGAAVLAIVGVSSILKAFDQTGRPKVQSNGYGSSPYGGDSAGAKTPRRRV